MLALACAFYLRDWLEQRQGQGLAEYSLILALIAVVVIAAVTGLGKAVFKVFFDVWAAITYVNMAP